AQEWNFALPDRVGSIDYAFSKGANAALNVDIERMPMAARGVFWIVQDIRSVGPRLTGILDGTSQTIAIGEAAGGTSVYLCRDPSNPSQPATNGLTGRPAIIDQAWGAGSVAYDNEPWYGSVFAVTAQYGLGNNPKDEAMNQPLVAPTMYGNDPQGDNAAGKDW